MPQNPLIPREPFPLDGQGFLKAPIFHALPWLRHGFGTRLSPDWPENRWAGAGIVRLKQIHSNRVVDAGSLSPDIVEDGDALIAAHPGKLLCIRTADCIPILIADPRSHAVAAIHAGWRGTVADVGGATILAMRRLFGAIPQDLLAAIGPGIGPCCFEVGPEVSAQFREIFPERNDLGIHASVDLSEANRRKLIGAGLDPENIVSDTRCTRCDGAFFHSWRRDGAAAGRMTAAIGGAY